LIPTPIRQVLLTFQKHGVQALLMGGQACVFYGAAQVSKDIDFVLLADDANFERLHQALAELGAERIAIPRFSPEVLTRGHAVHFRCQANGVEGLRVDVMTKLRELVSFDRLWERRTVFGDDSGAEYNLLSVPDLVHAKKTQRNKDWPVIELLVAIHHRENVDHAASEWIEFWLSEARSPELIQDLCRRFPAEAVILQATRPLLQLALADDLEPLRAALDAEVRAEQAKDRAYWEPLRREMEQFRREEREQGVC
jgi:hypothetical protein